MPLTATLICEPSLAKMKTVHSGPETLGSNRTSKGKKVEPYFTTNLSSSMATVVPTSWHVNIFPQSRERPFGFVERTPLRTCLGAKIHTRKLRNSTWWGSNRCRRRSCRKNCLHFTIFTLHIKNTHSAEADSPRDDLVLRQDQPESALEMCFEHLSIEISHFGLSPLRRQWSNERSTT